MTKTDQDKSTAPPRYVMEYGPIVSNRARPIAPWEAEDVTYVGAEGSAPILLDKLGFAYHHLIPNNHNIKVYNTLLLLIRCDRFSDSRKPAEACLKEYLKFIGLPTEGNDSFFCKLVPNETTAPEPNTKPPADNIEVKQYKLSNEDRQEIANRLTWQSFNTVYGPVTGINSAKNRVSDSSDKSLPFRTDDVIQKDYDDIPNHKVNSLLKDIDASMVKFLDTFPESVANEHLIKSFDEVQLMSSIKLSTILRQETYDHTVSKTIINNYENKIFFMKTLYNKLKKLDEVKINLQNYVKEITTLNNSSIYTIEKTADEQVNNCNALINRIDETLDYFTKIDQAIQTFTESKNNEKEFLIDIPTLKMIFRSINKNLLPSITSKSEEITFEKHTIKSKSDVLFTNAKKLLNAINESKLSTHNELHELSKDITFKIRCFKKALEDFTQSDSGIDKLLLKDGTLTKLLSTINNQLPRTPIILCANVEGLDSNLSELLGFKDYLQNNRTLESLISQIVESIESKVNHSNLYNDIKGYLEKIFPGNTPFVNKTLWDIKYTVLLLLEKSLFNDELATNNEKEKLNDNLFSVLGKTIQTAPYKSKEHEKHFCKLKDLIAQSMNFKPPIDVTLIQNNKTLMHNLLVATKKPLDELISYYSQTLSNPGQYADINQHGVGDEQNLKSKIQEKIAQIKNQYIEAFNDFLNLRTDDFDYLLFLGKSVECLPSLYSDFLSLVNKNATLLVNGRLEVIKSISDHNEKLSKDSQSILDRISQLSNPVITNDLATFKEFLDGLAHDIQMLNVNLGSGCHILLSLDKNKISMMIKDISERIDHFDDVDLAKQLTHLTLSNSIEKLTQQLALGVNSDNLSTMRDKNPVKRNFEELFEIDSEYLQKSHWTHSKKKQKSDHQQADTPSKFIPFKARGYSPPELTTVAVPQNSDTIEQPSNIAMKSTQEEPMEID